MRDLLPGQRRAYAELALAILGDGQRMTELFASIGFRSHTGDVAPLRVFADLMLDVFREGAGADVFEVDARARLERSSSRAGIDRADSGRLCSSAASSHRSAGS